MTSMQRRRDVRTAYLLLSPAVILLLAVLAYPVGWEIWTSLTAYSPLQDGATRFVGFQNYRDQLADPQFWLAVAVTLVYAIVRIAAKVALGLGFAIVAFGVDASRLPRELDGYGYLVPRGEHLTSLGGVHDSALFPGRAHREVRPDVPQP